MSSILFLKLYDSIKVTTSSYLYGETYGHIIVLLFANAHLCSATRSFDSRTGLRKTTLESARERDRESMIHNTFFAIIYIAIAL